MTGRGTHFRLSSVRRRPLPLKLKIGDDLEVEGDADELLKLIHGLRGSPALPFPRKEPTPAPAPAPRSKGTRAAPPKRPDVITLEAVMNELVKPEHRRIYSSIYEASPETTSLYDHVQKSGAPPKAGGAFIQAIMGIARRWDVPEQEILVRNTIGRTVMVKVPFKEGVVQHAPQVSPDAA